MKRLPNLITLLRVVLTCFLNIYILHNPGKISAPIVLYFLIFLSDFMDGKIARIFEYTSSFGAVFDVVVDLFYIVASYCTLVYLNIAPFWFLMVILIKFMEFVITSFLLKRRSRVNSMFIFDFIGRLTSVLFYITPLLMYVSYQQCQLLYLFMSKIFIYGVTAIALVSAAYRIKLLEMNNQ